MAYNENTGRGSVGGGFGPRPGNLGPGIQKQGYRSPNVKVAAERRYNKEVRYNRAHPPQPFKPMTSAERTKYKNAPTVQVAYHKPAGL